MKNINNFPESPLLIWLLFLSDSPGKTHHCYGWKLSFGDKGYIPAVETFIFIFLTKTEAV